MRIYRLQRRCRRKTAYLQQKLAAIHVKITEITVRDWFSGKRRPSLDSRSRKLVYEICFALGASFELVQEFFRQVYFQPQLQLSYHKRGRLLLLPPSEPFLRSCSRALRNHQSHAGNGKIRSFRSRLHRSDPKCSRQLPQRRKISRLLFQK